jgi:signal transduction histidine kinase
MTTGSLPPHRALSSSVSTAVEMRSALSERCRSEQVEALYRHAPGNYLATLVTAAIACVVLYAQVPPLRLWGWFGVVAVFTVIRFHWLRRYHASKPHGADAGRWALGYVVTSAVAGTLWGSAAHVLMPPESLALQAFVYILIAGMMAGAALALTVYLPAYLAFILPLGILVMLSMLGAATLVHDHGRAMIGLAALLTGWIGITWYFAHTANSTYLRALRLDHENRALDRVLSDRIADIESNNKTLAAQVALREAMEEDLRRAKEQLQLALRASELSIWDWTLERNRVYLDATWATMLGHEPQARHYSIEELSALVHPDDLHRARKAQIACLKGDTEEYSVEHRVRAADGRWVWIMSRGRVADRDARGMATRMIGTNLNITVQKEAQAHIETLNQALQAKLAELADANRDLQNFSTMVSHDLHAPLRRIAGFADMLAQRGEAALDAESRHFLQRIRHNVHRMSVLIDDLLEFARSTSAELACQTVDLAALVHGVVAETVDVREADAIRWSIGRLPQVHADPALLKVVFVNLIGNAVKFTRTREQRRIEIGTLASAADEHVVYVRDNGVGFDPRDKDRIFLAFQRLHSEREFEGTGIGLTTVHRIVERHGGRLWADGDVDRGATFYLAFPDSTAGAALSDAAESTT